MLFGFLVKICKSRTTVLRVLPEIEITPVGNALEFAPAHWKQILDVVAVFGIVGKFILFVLPQAQVVFIYTDGVKPVHSLFQPVMEPFNIVSRFDEKFHFHLLEFTAAENKIACSNFIAKGLADLGDAER